MSESCCCCAPTEEKKPLTRSGCSGEGQPVTTQPTSQKYTTGNHEKTGHELCELSTLRDEKDILAQQLQEKEERYNKEIESCNLENIELKKEVENLKSKHDELLIRLSAAAGAKLTDENPNIADLSDMNRPTKLAEQFSEVYDNEWTDAFEGLTNEDKGNKTEKEACELLLRVLTTIYLKCHAKSREDLQGLTKVLSSFNGMDVPSKDILKALKDDRKRNCRYTIHKLEEVIKPSLQDIITEKDATYIDSFIDKCKAVCWLMAIQDPPVVMDVEIDRLDEALDKDKYKHYTQSGTVIDYIVWPVLHLCEGGNILSKGIAQGKNPDFDAGVNPENETTRL